MCGCNICFALKLGFAILVRVNGFYCVCFPNDQVMYGYADAIEGFTFGGYTRIERHIFFGEPI